MIQPDMAFQKISDSIIKLKKTRGEIRIPHRLQAHLTTFIVLILAIVAKGGIIKNSLCTVYIIDSDIWPILYDCPDKYPKFQQKSN